MMIWNSTPLWRQPVTHENTTRELNGFDAKNCSFQRQRFPHVLPMVASTSSPLQNPLRVFWISCMKSSTSDGNSTTCSHVRVALLCICTATIHARHTVCMHSVQLWLIPGLAKAGEKMIVARKVSSVPVRSSPPICHWEWYSNEPSTINMSCLTNCMGWLVWMFFYIRTRVCPRDEILLLGMLYTPSRVLRRGAEFTSHWTLGALGGGQLSTHIRSKKCYTFLETFRSKSSFSGGRSSQIWVLGALCSRSTTTSGLEISGPAERAC